MNFEINRQYFLSKKQKCYQNECQQCKMFITQLKRTNVSLKLEKIIIYNVI